MQIKNELGIISAVRVLLIDASNLLQELEAETARELALFTAADEAIDEAMRAVNRLDEDEERR
jgi:hypothetical protein